MRGTSRALVFLAVTAPMLGACNSMFGEKTISVRASQSMPQESSAADYGADQIAQGRRALDEGQVSLAVTAFRNAKQFSAHAAAAYNGLAVAYSQLGRSDLAERYFREAVAMAPEDKRYQANLERFYRLNAIALPQPASGNEVAVKTPPSRSTLNAAMGVQILSKGSSTSAITVARPVSRLARVSASEVRIGTSQPGSVTPTPQPRAAAITVEKPAVQVGGSYPVRVSFASPDSAAGQIVRFPIRRVPTSSSRRQYPIKVGLRSSR